MKKNFINVAIIATLAASFVFCSCDKEENVEIINSNQKVVEQPIEFQLVDVSTILTISKNMEAMVDTLQTIEMTRGTAALSTNPYAQMSEVQIEKELQPLVSSGREIQSALISAVNNPAYGLELTTAEYEALKKLDDAQLAELSLQLSMVYTPENIKQFDGMQITTKKVIDCLAHATGITDIQSFFKGGLPGSPYALINGTKQLINAKTACQLLKAIGLRSFGWIGVGIMIVQFTDCIKN